MASRFQQKLIVPSSTSALVERDDLLIQLDQAITTKRIIALTAPAGWGKTTILAQWVACGTLPVVWYTLDATDRDPRVFLDYLVAALAAVAPGLAEIDSQLASAPPQTLSELYRATAHEIAGVARPFALVLDDFHTLEEDLSAALPGTSLIFEFLSSLAAYAPCCHLVFASRTLPSLRGLARLGAQQLAARFDYVALQWTAGDVQRLAGVTRGVALAEADAERLVASMSGWVTGIVLSLDQVDGGGDVALALTDDTGPIYSFFAEQLTAPLSPELQRFLEDTSVLEELSPQRCNLLRGAQDSGLFLDDLARRSLFISRRGSWLHHHSLFRDFLRSRLAKHPAREQALLRRAGDLYRDEDDVERALACYLAAGAGDAAVELLHAAVPRFRKDSRQTTLLACFERIGQLRSLPPQLLLDQARVYGDLALWERAYLALQLAETIGSEEIGWEARLLEADAALMQGHPARARKALDEISQGVLPLRLQFDYYRIVGRAHVLAENIEAAIQAFEMAQRVAPAVLETASDPSALASIYDNLGRAYMIQGDRQLAVRYLQRADACWQASGNNGRRAMTLNNLGVMIQEERRYAEARALFETGLALARQTVRRREETYLLCSIADLDIIEDRLDDAQARFHEAYNIAQRHDIPFLANAAAVGGLWVAALSGNLDPAWEWEALVHLHREAPAAPEVRGRRALAQGLLLLRRADPDLAGIAALAHEATVLESALPFPDRVYLPLLRATAAFERGGWSDAAPDWDLFVQTAAGWSDAALLRLLVPHHAIFQAAAATSSLARRMVATIDRPIVPQWHITAFGTFSCTTNNAQCRLSPIHQALLVRLLDAGPGGLAIERVWESVWGEASDLSMGALHQALRRIRRYTELEVIVRDGMCKIQSPWEAIFYDVHEFERLIAKPADRESMQQAMALYRGDFLASAPSSASLWVDTRRVHLQQRYLDALEQFATAVEREAPQLAVDYYQRILQIDGCREHTAATLMQLAARFGNRSLLHATFEQLNLALRSLGATPDPTVVQLYQQLR